jgi:hypothetical protein
LPGVISYACKVETNETRGTAVKQGLDAATKAFRGRSLWLEGHVESWEINSSSSGVRSKMFSKGSKPHSNKTAVYKLFHDEIEL